MFFAKGKQKEEAAARNDPLLFRFLLQIRLFAPIDPSYLSALRGTSSSQSVDTNPGNLVREASGLV
jgi:hypothetical protein